MSEMRHHTTATHLPSDGHLPGQKTKKIKIFLLVSKKAVPLQRICKKRIATP